MLRVDTPAAVTSTFLTGIRVVELADELGEPCGRLLAGLGADVVKIEPPGGERTRRIGPFAGDRPDPDRSLHFWHYNFGKRSVVLDLDSAAGRDSFAELVDGADVLLDTRGPDYLARRGLGFDVLRQRNRGLVYLRISPFGDDGPWAGFQGSDLVHLALGGIVMNCGYDPLPAGTYDTAPVAPQPWLAYAVTGELTAIQVIAALIYRNATGEGQRITASVHEAVNANTETDVPDWVFRRMPRHRLTCRHAFSSEAPPGGSASVSAFLPPGPSPTRDGRWVLPYRTFNPGFGTPVARIAEYLGRFGMAEDLADPKYGDPAELARPETVNHISAVVDRFVRAYPFDQDLWLEAQHLGMEWAPLRYPHENVTDKHWRSRETFAEVFYPQIGREVPQIRGKWVSPNLPWRTGPRAPLLGEHTGALAVPGGLWPQTAAVGAGPAAPHSAGRRPSGAAPSGGQRPSGAPFALDGVRVIDLGWFLASGGAGRFLTAHGAEVIKVEHLSRLDGMRFSPGTVPDGGRRERDAATSAVYPRPSDDPNRSGTFIEMHTGKRAISLNLKDLRGKDLLRALVAKADVLLEGYSPGAMDRMGLGYDQLHVINPALVYVAQSGMGKTGPMSFVRSYGPTAQATSGLSEMSGLPEPHPPAGIGYSFLDWMGAYQMALATMVGLYHRKASGQGCWIDASQIEAGVCLTGTAILDHAVNGRRSMRFGNRSPYLPAAPHGIYPAEGKDRWIAISAYSDEQWVALTRVLGRTEWTADPDLATLGLRVAHQDRLDQLVADATRKLEPFQLMADLQAAGVPAGVCQTAEDRCDRDPQLRHLGWQVELPQTDKGWWPLRRVPFDLEVTPTYLGGLTGRAGPSYAEDNGYVYGTVLGLPEREIQQLAKDGVL
jgi:crotonobetainyl-CoA:carnitine CoA-transferase CaiB-like acyl-CoA transferase